jgi:hypothetical protein
MIVVASSMRSGSARSPKACGVSLLPAAPAPGQNDCSLVEPAACQGALCVRLPVISRLQSRRHIVEEFVDFQTSGYDFLLQRPIDGHFQSFPVRLYAKRRNARQGARRS